MPADASLRSGFVGGWRVGHIHVGQVRVVFAEAEEMLPAEVVQPVAEQFGMEEAKQRERVKPSDGVRVH